MVNGCASNVALPITHPCTGLDKIFISLQAGQNFPPARQISLQCGDGFPYLFLYFFPSISQKFPGKELPVLPVFSHTKINYLH